MKKFAVKLLKNTFTPLNYPDNVELEHGQMILASSENGEEVLKVHLINSQIIEQWKDKEPKAIDFVRSLNKSDLEQYEEQQKLECEAYFKCREMIKNRKLNMNLVQVRYTYDRRKVTFFYTAPERVDFRELLKELTQVFKRVRIDLRHIGVRDETSIVQGSGLCGRSFCCCTFLRNFESINVKLARDQGMPIAPGKISGTCGRLLCCLNYEYQNYLQAAKDMPPIGSGVMSPDGLGRVCSLNFLKDKVSIKLEDGKIKEFARGEIEMIDGEVNIEIEANAPSYNQVSSEEDVVDIKALEDDSSGSTGNI